MRTYLFDTIERYKRFSESLDVKAVICNKSWNIFNDSGEKEIYIFQEDGSLIISNNGKVTDGNWKYIPANKSIIINGNEQSYMLHPAFMDEVIFALQVDGTQQCAFLIDESNKQSFEPKTYSELLQYFNDKEQRRLDEEKWLVVKQQIESRRIQEKEEQQAAFDAWWEGTDSLRREICMYKGRTFITYATYFIFDMLGIALLWWLFVSKNLFFFQDSDYLNIVLGLIYFFGLTVGVGFIAIHILNLIHYSIDKRKIKKWIKNNPNDSRIHGLLWNSYGDYWGIWGMGINRESILGYSYK